MSPLIPRRRELPLRTHFGQSLLLSRVMDRLSHRKFGSRGYVCVHCTLQPGALRILLSSMLSEGSVALLSRHDASPATGLESFSPGWSLTNWQMCPFLDTPMSPRPQYRSSYN